MKIIGSGITRVDGWVKKEILAEWGPLANTQ